MSPDDFGRLCAFAAAGVDAGQDLKEITLRAQRKYASIDVVAVAAAVKIGVVSWMRMKHPPKVGASGPNRIAIVRPTGGRGWTPPAAVVARMGQESDRMLSRECGVGEKSIREARQRLGIAPFMAPPGWIEWTDEEESLLGTDVDRVVARLLGYNHQNVKDRRTKLGIPAKRKKMPWTPARIARLHGERNDKRAAAMLGLSVAGVKTARYRFKEK